MTERLHRVHALLRAGNVPCTMRPDHGSGLVLLAGTPNQGPYEVLLRDSGHDLWLHYAGEAVRLPDAADDTSIANAVKFRVVQAWADQGDAEAKAVVAKLKDSFYPSAHDGAGYPEHVAYDIMVEFVDPMQFAAELAADMFDFAAQLGWAFLRGRSPFYPASSLANPWAQTPWARNPWAQNPWTQYGRGYFSYPLSS
jgi:hypothetical protein